MKVLLISENEEKSDIIKNSINELFSGKGYEIIHYRSFFKALDNVEEISPDEIFVNAIDFSRHWKIIFQYTNIILKDKKINKTVFVQKNFCEEEINKARFLQASIIYDENTISKNNSEGNNMENSTPLYTVDNLFEDSSYRLATVDDLFSGMENPNIFGDDIPMFDISEEVENTPSQTASSSQEVSSQESASQESKSLSEENPEDELPTVSKIIQSNTNYDDSKEEKDEDLLNEIKNVILEKNDYKLFSVDDLFTTSEDDYKLTTVDNLLLEESKKITGSLLKKIMEMKYYEK